MNKELFRQAILIRHFEEKLLTLFSEGRLHGTVHTCIGQELSALAVAEHLEDGDWVFSNHRCHGHYLAWNGDVKGLLAEIMGKASGICAGRGGSQHIYRDQFLSNGVQGGGVPIAAGCALALTQGKDGRSLAVAFIGDGTLGQGIVYETMNLARLWDIPLLIVLEHNGYAQSTNTTNTIAGGIRQRFEAFGVKFWEGTIWRQEELFASARAATEYVRNERAPAALCIQSYRLKAHSKGDDNRARAEVDAYLDRDPLQVFENKFPDISQKFRQECESNIQEILASFEAQAAAEPVAPASVASSTLAKATTWRPGSLAARLGVVASLPRVQERLRLGLKTLMARDERVRLIGEDIEDPYGGAFKISKGLSTEFPGRVRNTPISEAAIAGFGNGLALAGLRPIVEIMFGDFITLAADQLINQASKFAYMYAGQVSVPVIIRTPMGGKRGYGATHSQSLEKHFFGTPGLHIAAVNAVSDPALLLERIHEHLHEPCLLIENKLLYGVPVRTTASDGRLWLENDAPFPTLKLDAAGKGDVTVVTYGGMVEEVEEAVRHAFIENEIVSEVLVPTMIFPLDLAPILESVARTGRLVVVEEGQGFAGFGAEVIASCAERLPGMALRSARVHAEPHPIPCSRDLEKEALPAAAQVLDALRNVVKP